MLIRVPTPEARVQNSTDFLNIYNFCSTFDL